MYSDNAGNLAKNFWNPFLSRRCAPPATRYLYEAGRPFQPTYFCCFAPGENTVMSYDPHVLTHKTVLMQRLADHVRQGYHWHVSGSVPLDRAAAFIRKISTLYSLNIGKDERYRRKKAGLGNAQLLLWQPEPPSGPLAWWLLITDGDHPAHTLEKLRDAHGKNGRIQCTGYELVQLTRAGQVAPSWTWRMSKETYEAWRTRILQAVRARTDEKLRQSWQSLYRVPGFSGNRRQVGKLVALMRAEWARSRAEPFPMGRSRLGYIQRLETVYQPLSTVLWRAREAAISTDHS